jgi:Ca-activated chloride channel family protein
MAHTLTRRTAALAAIAGLIVVSDASAQQRQAPGDDAWSSGDFEAALRGYWDDVQQGIGGDTAWLNAGTAALAMGDSSTARSALTHASQSLDPEIRFRAAYNLGLLNLRLAETDSTNAATYLEQARDWYRESLLLRPSDADAKWNYELALSRLPPPQGGGGGSQNQPSGGGAPQEQEQRPTGGLTRSQAEQILDSMLEQERETRESLNRRRSRSRTAIRRKDW